MSEPTAKSLARRLNLIVNPGTDEQRALTAGVPADRLDLRAQALARAGRDYPGAPLAWLDTTSRTMTAV